MRPNRKTKQKKEIITKPASSRNRRDHMMFRGGNPRSCQTKIVLGMSMRIRSLT